MIRLYALIIACILHVFSVLPAQAREWRAWCGVEAPLGWHFYCDRDEKKDEETQAGQTPPPSAKERIHSLRKALEDARAQAILEPTPQNVTAYLRLQQEALQSAAAFSDAFRRAVWANPSLDYTLRRPRRRARQEALDRGAPGGARRGARQARGALRPHLPGIGQMPGVPRIRAAAARIRASSRTRSPRRIYDGRSY